MLRFGEDSLRVHGDAHEAVPIKPPHHFKENTMPAFGEVVKYTEFGRSYNAIVIGQRELEHHTGEDNEPLLNLVIVRPVSLDQCQICGCREAQHGKPAPANLHVCKEFTAPDPIVAINPLDYVRTVGDVPHESHAFNEEQLKAIAKTGVNVPQSYPGGVMPGGRWSEILPADLFPAVEPTPATPAEGTPTIQ